MCVQFMHNIANHKKENYENSEAFCKSYMNPHVQSARVSFYLLIRGENTTALVHVVIFLKAYTQLYSFISSILQRAMAGFYN